MILEFNHKKSSVTFGGGRFVCIFKKQGLRNKKLKLSVFEANANYRPLDTRKPLHEELVLFDEKKVFPTITVLGQIDEGTAYWIPEEYVKNKNSAQADELEEAACAIAFGLADRFIKKKDYFSALMNINASLLSHYIRQNPRLNSRLLKLQSLAWAGTSNFQEAAKSYRRAIEIYKAEATPDDYDNLKMLESKIA